MRDFSVSSANLSSETGVRGAWNAGRDMFTARYRLDDVFRVKRIDALVKNMIPV